MMSRLPASTRLLDLVTRLILPPVWGLEGERLARYRQWVPPEPLHTIVYGRLIPMRTEDLLLRELGHERHVRVYTPDELRSDALLVYFHGGGFVIGGLPTHDRLCRRLAHHLGVTLASVSYRLAPDHPYPAAAEDAHAVTQRLMQQAARRGLDATRCIVMGDSAGANLATVTCLMARDRDQPMPAAQVLYYPALDMTMGLPSHRELGNAPILQRRTMEYFRDHYTPDPEVRREPYASPLHAPDLSGLPPALILSAECDPLRDDGVFYAQRLEESGVDVEVSIVARSVHGFMNLVGWTHGAREAVSHTASFLSARGLRESA